METANILTSKGTTTIPKTIRDELGLKPGNRVRLAKNKQGAYVIEKELTLEEVRKMNTKYVKKVVKRLSK